MTPLPPIDPDVRHARLLDRAFYLDPAWFERCRETVFARSWQWLGTLEDLATPRSLSPRTLLPGHLDEPALLARDDQQVLRCLSNVCTHRGKLLVEQAAAGAAQIRCAYHGRRFGLDGRFASMPGFEGACDFPSATDDLPAFDFGTWEGHGFAAAATPSMPLAAWLAPLEHWLPPLAMRDATWGRPIGGFEPDPARERSYEFEAHWALYVENYLEGLHIPFVHPGLRETIRMADYRYALAPAAVLQQAMARDGQAAFGDGTALQGAGGQRIAAVYVWLFPNLMLNFYPWGLSLNVVVPLTPSRTRVLFRSFVADRSRLDAGAGGALDPVELEDEAAVASVQQGIRSRRYRGGRYAPEHEAGVHAFHRMLLARLAVD